MIHKIGALTPVVDPSVTVAWTAEVAGDVKIGKNSSVWFSATIRADIAPVVLGESVNVQDNAVIHVDLKIPCVLEDAVTVGHGAILHSCTVGSGTTVGMGAIILNGAKIGKNCMVAAGALVTPNKTFEDGSMIMGSPAKVVRSLSAEEIEGMKRNNAEYALLAKSFGQDYERLDN